MQPRNNVEYQTQPRNNVEYQMQPRNNVEYQMQPRNNVEYQTQPRNNIEYQTKPRKNTEYSSVNQFSSTLNFVPQSNRVDAKTFRDHHPTHSTHDPRGSNKSQSIQNLVKHEAHASATLPSRPKSRYTHLQAPVMSSSYGSVTSLVSSDINHQQRQNSWRKSMPIQPRPNIKDELRVMFEFLPLPLILSS